MKSLIFALCLCFSAATAQAADTCDEQPVVSAPGLFAAVATQFSPYLGLPAFVLTDYLLHDESVSRTYLVLGVGSALLLGTYMVGAYITAIPLLPLFYVYGLGYAIWTVGYLIPAAFVHAGAQTLWFAIVAPKMAQTERCKIDRKKQKEQTSLSIKPRNPEESEREWVENTKARNY
jgi:hypothetical protein